MKSWYKYWKENYENETLGEAWRNEPLNDDSTIAFIYDEVNHGPASFAGGCWYWSNNLRKFASFLLEIKLRGIVAAIKNHDFDLTLDCNAIDYVIGCLNAQDQTDAKFLLLATEIAKSLKSNSVSFEKLYAWCQTLCQLSKEEPESVKILLCKTVDDAMPLLIAHESQRRVDNEAMPLQFRFEEDYGYFEEV